jgi:hypothetical protein
MSGIYQWSLSISSHIENPVCISPLSSIPTQPCYLFSLTPKYLLQYPILKHSSSIRASVWESKFHAHVFINWKQTEVLSFHVLQYKDTLNITNVPLILGFCLNAPPPPLANRGRPKFTTPRCSDLLPRCVISKKLRTAGINLKILNLLILVRQYTALVN